MTFLSTAWHAAQPSFFIIASAEALSRAAFALPATISAHANPANFNFIHFPTNGSAGRMEPETNGSTPGCERLFDIDDRRDRRQACRSPAHPCDGAPRRLLSLDERRRRPIDRRQVEDANVGPI